MLRICRVSCGTFTMKWWSEPHGSLGSRSFTGIFGAGKTGCQLGWVVLELIRRDESLKSYPIHLIRNCSVHVEGEERSGAVLKP